MANQHNMSAYPVLIDAPGPWQDVETEVLGRVVTHSQRLVTTQELADRPYVYRRTYAVLDTKTKRYAVGGFKLQRDAAKWARENDPGW